MDLGIAGRRALVCAASKGLGRGCARGARERRRGGHDRRADGSHALRKRPGDRRRGRTVACDITTPEGRAAALAACPDPDILVNNAGGPPPGDFRDFDRDAWIRAIDANMLTPIELIKATVDEMTERKFGRIVNITSSAVKAPIDILGLSNGARSGLTGFVAGFARKLARDGVTINNLLPGQLRHRSHAHDDGGPRQGRGQGRGDNRGGGARVPFPRGASARRRIRRGVRVHLQHARGLPRRTEHPARRRRLPRDVLILIPDRNMLDLYYWTTPNGHKITIFLEETGLPYTIKPVNISKGDQFDPRLPGDLAQQPHSGDRRPRAAGRRARRSRMFESGAILLYLAGKTGRFYPRDLRGRCEVAQWLFWQMGGLGPMAGQNAPLRAVRAGEDPVRDQPLREGNAAAVSRAGPAGSPTASSSRATTASPTWRAIRGFARERQGQDIDEFPNLARWLGD